MKIALTLNAHGNTELVLDTLSSIRKYVTNDILVVIDGAAWDEWGNELKIPAYKTCGFYHNYGKSPYRNITFGMYQTLKLFPNADWYCYVEYDALFCSDAFKEDLEQASKEGVWCVGNDARYGNYKFPLLEAMLKEDIESSKYLLGCCLFHHKKFIRKLEDISFFERFLYLTNDFSKGFFPGYEEQGGYDLAEHMYPTLANHYGGKIKGMAYWENVWYGKYRRWMLRWKPDILMDEISLEDVSILHPIKDYNHPIRQMQREKRNG